MKYESELLSLKKENHSQKDEIQSLKKELEDLLEQCDWEHLKEIHRLENIIYNEKEEDQEIQLVTSSSELEKKVETENRISGPIAPAKRPRGRPKKNIDSVKNDLKKLLFEDTKTTTIISI